MGQEGRVSRKVRLRWREWSMRQEEFLGRRGQLRRSLNRGKAFVSEPEPVESGEDLPNDENEPELDQGGQSGAHQQVPAAA